MKRILLILLSLATLAGASDAPERKVERNVIRSQRDPAVTITLPKAVKYAGASRWELYGVADCELHAFVEPFDSAQGFGPEGPQAKQNVRRLYWVQFEQYLPSHPNAHYTYDSPEHTTIGGFDFYVDTWPQASDEKTRPGSDREHITKLIADKGYRMPAGMMYVRLVHLLDEQKRKELMIIYGEDLVSTGFTVADLAKNGKAYDQWPALQKSLIEHAREKIKVEPVAKP